jgi:hypothetical protein
LTTLNLSRTSRRERKKTIWQSFSIAIDGRLRL